MGVYLPQYLAPLFQFWEYSQGNPSQVIYTRLILGCLPFVGINQLGWPLNNGKGFRKAANQPNKMVLTIYNSVSTRDCNSDHILLVSSIVFCRRLKKETGLNWGTISQWQGNFHRSVPNGRGGVF